MYTNRKVHLVNPHNAKFPYCRVMKNATCTKDMKKVTCTICKGTMKTTKNVMPKKPVKKKKLYRIIWEAPKPKIKWRTIPTSQQYEASDTGLVRKKDTKAIRKPFVQNTVAIVGLQDNDGNRKITTVARAVWSAFNNPPDEEYVVRHKEEKNPNDNSLKNLYAESRVHNVRKKSQKLLAAPQDYTRMLEPPKVVQRARTVTNTVAHFQRSITEANISVCSDTFKEDCSRDFRQVSCTECIVKLQAGSSFFRFFNFVENIEQNVKAQYRLPQQI